jgi:hypothetical protein
MVNDATRVVGTLVGVSRSMPSPSGALRPDDDVRLLARAQRAVHLDRDLHGGGAARLERDVGDADRLHVERRDGGVSGGDCDPGEDKPRSRGARGDDPGEYGSTFVAPLFL